MTPILVHPVVFLQGEDANAIFRLMYPEGKAYGSEKLMRNVVDYLKEYDNGDCLKWEELDTIGTTGIYRTKFHIVTWNYPLSWVAFYRRTNKRALGLKTK
jgi:hypothetical protein